MTELRDEVARALARDSYPNLKDAEIGERAEGFVDAADAAIAIVIERAAKVAEDGPPFAYVQVGEKGADFDKPGSPYDRGVADERARIHTSIRNLAPETTQPGSYKT